jgi:hypothetical protein
MARTDGGEVTIDSRNQSPYGWWIASYVMRQVWDEAPALADDSPCLAWENTVVVRADDRDAAYDKVLEIAELNSTGVFSASDDETRTGPWVLEGLTLLLPIYEPLEDGAEILWVEHDDKSVDVVRAMAKSKQDLPVFHDEGASATP